MEESTENKKDCWQQSNLGDTSVICTGDAEQDRHSYNLTMANTAISEGNALRVGNYKKKSILQNKLHSNPMLITLKALSLIHVSVTFSAARVSACGGGRAGFQ